MRRILLASLMPLLNLGLQLSGYTNSTVAVGLWAVALIIAIGLLVTWQPVASRLPVLRRLPWARPGRPALEFVWRPQEPYQHKLGYRVGVRNTGPGKVENLKATLWEIQPGNRIPSGAVPRLLRWTDNALMMHVTAGRMGERLLEIMEDVHEGETFKVRFPTNPPFEFEPDVGLTYRGTIRFFADNVSCEGVFAFRLNGPNMLYTSFCWLSPPTAESYQAAEIRRAGIRRTHRWAAPDFGRKPAFPRV